MSTRPVIRSLFLVLLVITLAACTAPTPPPATPTTKPAMPTTAPAQPTAAPVDDDWARVQASGVLRVGSSLDNPPFDMYNDDFEPDGFDVALMTELANQLGLKAEFNDFAFDGLLGALQLRRIDAAIATMSVTDARQEVADFTRSYYRGEDIILAEANSPITAVTTRADLAERRVGVQRGTVYENWLRTNLVETGEMKATNLQVYSRPEDAIAALSDRRVDLVIMDREPGLQQVAQGKAKEVGKSLYVQDYAIALRKGSPITPHLNQALAKVVADGTVARLAEEYLQIPADTYTPVPVPTEEPQPTTEPTVEPATPAPTPTPAPIDDMAWVTDLSYDDHDRKQPPVLQPGEAFNKGWRIRNSGTTTWSPDYQLVYAGGDSQMGGQPQAMGKEVAPQETIDVYVKLVAPKSPGVYTGYWNMRNTAGKAFGEKIWVMVQIPGPPTPVPPPTAVPPPTSVPVAGISFTADRYQITAGESTWLRWNVSGVQAVWLCTPVGANCKGVGAPGQEEVRPPATTTYGLRVQHADGRIQDVPLTITVTPGAGAPTVEYFNADPPNINAGGYVNIYWKVRGSPSRIALVRLGQATLKDYASAEDGYTDQPPGSGQVVYELQVWGPGGGEPQKHQRAVTIESGPPPCQPQTVDVYGCGSSQTLCSGSTLIVHLEAPGGTGYEWDLKEIDPNVLQPMGRQVIEAKMPGGPVVYNFTYRALRGQTTIYLILYRPSEGPDSAVESCYIPVTVQ